MNTLPLTVRRSVEIVGLIALGWVLVLAQSALAPLLTAFFIALVFMPLHRRLARKVPDALAIFICVLMLIIIGLLFVWFFYSQLSNLLADLPTIRQNVTKHLSTLSSWIARKFGVESERQVSLIKDQSNKLLGYTGQVLSGTVGSVTSIIIFLSLMPLYIFLIMLYRKMFVGFINMWFRPESHDRVKDVLMQTQSVVKSYIGGLLLQITYMTALIGVTLMLFGIKHSLLIGLLFALLNLIPYVGALIGNVLGVLITLASSPDLGPIFTVLITIGAAQLLDNNILMPRIVGSKVSINPLATILGVIVGGMIAGIIGLFLALPIMAVLKIIFDRTDHLKQWGVLLGDKWESRADGAKRGAAELKVKSQK